jgi:phospholipase C
MAADIRHVIVLMLENRSFDMVFGDLYPASPRFKGLTGGEANAYLTYDYLVSSRTPVGADPQCVPTPDPGEQFTDITEQLFSDPLGHQKGLPLSMGGFARNYATQKAQKALYDPNAVMHYYRSADLPVLHELGAAFAVSDEWFASAPCQTWPNRFFAHCGTSRGIVDNDKFFISGEAPFRSRSIFRTLEDAGKSWRVYFHDMPQSILLADVMDVAPAHYHLFKSFLADAAQGTLPAYSFIEPQYFGDFFASSPPNDQHPPHNVQYGDRLVADVYNALRSSPCWKNTLLIVTYDEHGGCFDHVAPPKAVSPDRLSTEQGFTFDMYGVRVPAIIISPWVTPGSILRAADLGSAYPFDHTSIIKTLCELNGLTKLTYRDEAAPSLLPHLSLRAPHNDGPASVGSTRPMASRTELWSMGQAPPNDLHKALARFADTLKQDMNTAGHDLGDAVETVAQLGTRAAAQVRAFLEIK